MIVNETAAARKGDVLGNARASTVDQDASGQKDRLMDVGTIRVFTPATASASRASTAMAGRRRNCSKSSRTSRSAASTW